MSLRLFAYFTTCANYQIKAMSLFMVMSMLKYVNYVGRGHHSGGGQQHQRGQQSGRQHQDGEGQVFMAVKKTVVSSWWRRTR